MGTVFRLKDRRDLDEQMIACHLRAQVDRTIRRRRRAEVGWRADRVSFSRRTALGPPIR